MKLGFNEATCMKRSSVELDLRLCEKYGYDYIELRLDMLKDYLNRNKIADLESFFHSSHLKPWALNSIENINFCTTSEWDELVALFKFACEIGQAIDVPYLVVVPSMGPDMWKKSQEEVFKDSVDALSKLAELARPYGIKLAFEPIGNKRWCVRSLDQALEIVMAVGSANVGFALDAFNLFLNKRLADIDGIDKLPSNKIFIYHIDDCEDLPLEVLDHCHRLYPGDGVIPLNEISKKLHAKGYIGSCSIELFRPQYWELEPEDVIKTAAEKTKPYL